MINVSKRYMLGEGVYVDALVKVNLDVNPGEVVTVMGPSGSGKTTLMNMVGTLDRPSEGRVIIDGVDVTDMDEDELAKFRLERLGFVFQQYNLIQTMTAMENVELPMILTGKYTKEEARFKARLLLELVGLGDVVDHRPSQLSGGEQQRVAIARALANNPVIIIMDEPTGAVDLANTYLILDLIRLLNQALGVTFIIATHNFEVASVGTRILYLRGGVLSHESNIDRIREQFRKPINREYMVNIINRILDIEEKILKRTGHGTTYVEARRRHLEKFSSG